MTDKKMESSGMEFFAKTVNDCVSFAVFADVSVLDVWRVS